MPISKEEFVNAVPGKTIFIGANGRPWDVVQKLGGVHSTFRLQPKGKKAEEFSYLDGQGIVDENIGVSVELNHPNAYATSKKE